MISPKNSKGAPKNWTQEKLGRVGGFYQIGLFDGTEFEFLSSNFNEEAL